jgi:hypothetical protein
MDGRVARRVTAQPSASRTALAVPRETQLTPWFEVATLDDELSRGAGAP